MFAALCSFALLATGELPAVTGQSSTATVDVHGGQWQAISANFAVRNNHPSHDARQVAEHCERWRTKLQKYWIAAEQNAWAAKCEVVVHANISTYLTAVGVGGRQTFGSSLVKF